MTRTHQAQITGEALVVAGEARAKAEEAVRRIVTHEQGCETRYRQLNSAIDNLTAASGRHQESLGVVHKRVDRGYSMALTSALSSIGVLFSMIFALFMFLLKGG